MKSIEHEKLCLKYGHEKVKRLKSIFATIRSRCYNKKDKQYADYGGRGIKVSKTWLSNPNKFVEWAIHNGYEEKLSIDRIDNNRGYCPNNCRYVDSFVQNNNARSNIIIEYNNEKYTLSKLCRKLEINYKWANCLYHSLENKEEFIEAVSSGKHNRSCKVINIEIDGVIYKNRREISKTFGISYKVIKTRWERGKRGTDLIKPVRKRRKS